MKNEKQSVTKTIAKLAGIGALLAGLHGQAASSPVVAIALAKVKPGTEEAFKRASLELVKETRKEAGVIGYVLHQSTTNPTEFAFYEQYKSQADADLHMQSPHLSVFFNKVKDSFEPGYPQIKPFREVE
jgi:quinol monooxygenase YgiN